MTTMLLEWVFTSIFLILTVLALRALFGRWVSARLRYGLWAVVLVRLLVPVQLFSSPLAGTWVFSTQKTERNVTITSDAHTEHGPDNVLSLDGQDGLSIPPKAPAFPDAPEPPTVPDAPKAPAAPDLTALPSWLGWVWLGGSASLALVQAASNLRFARRLRRRRVPMETDCPLPVYAAAGLPSPCLFGLLRPAVYVTPEAAADPAMLRHVTAHEYTHFRHGDHLWSFLRCAALAAHWWNPLVWLAVVLSRRDGELACDEGALALLGDGERLAYGNTLLALVTARPGPGDLLCFATTMAGEKKSLKERVSRIACAPRRILWAALAVVLVTALACLCAFGQTAEPDEPEDNPAPLPTERQSKEALSLADGEQQADLNRNGIPETLRVSGSDEEMRLEVWEDGKLIFSEEAYHAHAGYNALFLCTLDGEDCLLRYNPYMQQGWCDYSYKLFTLSADGEEQTVQEKQLEFCINLGSPMVFGGPSDGSFDPEKIAAFMDEINGLLANSVQLINTDADLLAAFQDAGRLVDDLWWLDIWEPVFTRDPSRPLLENLRDFQAAMEAEAAPKVQKAGVEGECLLTYGGMEKRFHSVWEPFYPDDTVDGQMIDLDGDDQREIVFSLPTGHGTGYLSEELHVFDAAALEEYDCSNVPDMILGQVSSYADEDRFYVSAPGLEAVIEKPDIDCDYQDSVNFGDFYYFQVENGRLYGWFGAALDRVNACYCGGLKVELRLDNGKLVCAGFEYKTDRDF